MTKQSKSFLWPIASLTLAMTIFAVPSFAQDSYTPPPLFEAPQAQPIPQQPNPAPAEPAFEPRYSPYTPPGRKSAAPAAGDKYTGGNNPLLPPVVTHGDPAVKRAAPKRTAPANPPVPSVKPPIPAATLKSAAPAPAPEPVQTPARKDPVPTQTNKPLPAARVTSEGVVTGPKTMPSVPTTDVAAENTFIPDRPAAQTMMERHQSLSQPATPQEVVTAPVEKDAPLTPVEALSLPFEKGVTSVENPPLGDLVDILRANPMARVMISAYATPVDDGENSDRRIALARALSLRKALVTAGADSRRIDIRALGRKTPGGAADRADLTILNGRKSAD